MNKKQKTHYPAHFENWWAKGYGIMDDLPSNLDTLLRGRIKKIAYRSYKRGRSSKNRDKTSE